MNLFKKSFFVLSFALTLTLLSACANKKEEKLVISHENTTSNVVRDQEVQIKSVINKEEVKEGITYEIKSGDAVINETGLLVVNSDARINSEIHVIANKGELVSNTLDFIVVDKAPTAITLVASSNVIKAKDTITFTVDVTPTNATLNDYELSIVGDCDFATLDKASEKLTLNADADKEAIDGSVITVRATLASDKTIFSEVKITVTTTKIIKALSADEVYIVAAKDASKYISVDAFDQYNELVTLDETAYTYEVSEEDKKIIAVDAEGKITPKGHGVANVVVKYGEVSTECKVVVMVAPERIEFVTTNDYLSRNQKLSYGKNDGYLALDLKITNKEDFLSSTENLEFTFELLIEEGKVKQSGESVGTYDKNLGFKFNVLGNVRITVYTNSSLEGHEVSQAYEAKTTFNVVVNDGVNVYNVSDFKKYASASYAGKIVNILGDINLTDTDNFGQNNAQNPYGTLVYRGTRTIEGNGYKLSIEQISYGGNKVADFLVFAPAKDKENYNLYINNFMIVGNNDVKGNYNGDSSKPMYENDDCKKGYRWGVLVTGVNYPYDTKIASVEEAIFDNVTIKGFEFGVRFRQVINAHIKNSRVYDQYRTGLENDQSHMILEDSTIDLVGTFGLEIVPDHVDASKAKENIITGTAGYNFNESPTIKFRGHNRVANYNTGTTTPAMTNLFADFGHSLFEIVGALISGTIQAVTQDTATQQRINATVMNALVKEIDGAQTLNCFTLIFVKPGKFPGFTDGNTKNSFCEFERDITIKLTDLVIGLAQNPNFYFNNKKFVAVDLDLTSLQMGNLGQVILFNNLAK